MIGTNYIGEAKRNAILNGFEKAQKIELKSAVAMVFNEKGEILLGKSKAKDDRKGKWCFPGGGIDKGENALQAAIRELNEEAGLTSTVISQVVFIHPAKPHVGFVVLKSESKQEIIPLEEEFEEMKWFSTKKLPKDLLSINMEIINLIYNQFKKD